MQERRHPHHEFLGELFAMAFALEPGEIEIERAHLNVGQHVDGVSKPGRDPHCTVRRHQPAAFWGRHLHGAGGSVNQLQLLMHVGEEAGCPC